MATSSLPASITRAALERQAEAAATGDLRAWSALMGSLEPLVRWLAARRAGRRLSEAGQNDVFVRVIDRLRTDNRRGLVRYVAGRERYRNLDFASYVAALVSSAMTDYIRRRPEKERPRHNTARELERAGGSGDTDARADLEALGGGHIPAAERRALLLWLHGNDAVDIAAELGLISSEDARRLLHAARERLRGNASGES